MLRVLQPIDWGLLPPFPIALHPRVTTLVGSNGSGKSSALDAVKASLGCSRFGQNRGCASYLNSGRGHHPPAREAFLLLCCTLPAERRHRPAFVDEDGQFTLLLWVTRTRRLRLALPGHLLLGVGERSLREDLDEFKERYPRNVWMRPEEFQVKVLDQLGATSTVQRLLEIPQGETQRLLEARPDRLLRDLLGLMGALEPLDDLAARRAEVQDAQTERDRAKRAVLEEELSLARALRDADDDGRLDAVEEQLGDVTAHARAAVRVALQQAAADLTTATAALEQCDLKLADARDRLEAARRRQRAAAAAPDDWKHATAAVRALRDAGIRCDVVAAGLDDSIASAAHVSALRHQVCAVVVDHRDWETLAGHVQSFAAVQFVRGVPDGDSLVAGWWTHQTDGLQLDTTATHVRIDDEAYVPVLDVQLPLSMNADDDVDTARSDVWQLERSRSDHAGQAEQLQRKISELDAVAADLGTGERLDADADELPGLLAERRRLTGRIEEMRAQARRRAARQEQLAAQQRRLDDAKTYLDGQDGALEQAHEALVAARDFYQGQVRHMISALDVQFRALCEAASMRGELHLTEDPLAEAGGRLDIRVAEAPGAQLRSYHGEADLSGGWRAKTSVLILLASLCAAGGDHVLPVACLDEHSAALDEDRIAELGLVFQRLARQRGLQIICAMPTKRSAERADWANQQIGFLKAAPDSMYAPLPHILEASEHATLPGA